MEDNFIFNFLDDETKLNVAIQTLQNRGGAFVTMPSKGCSDIFHDSKGCLVR